VPVRVPKLRYPQGAKPLISGIRNPKSRQLKNGGFQTWHGHLAREKRAISGEISPKITGKMPFG
jgi:hypothetical protein